MIAFERIGKGIPSNTGGSGPSEASAAAGIIDTELSPYHLTGIRTTFSALFLKRRYPFSLPKR